MKLVALAVLLLFALSAVAALPGSDCTESALTPLESRPLSLLGSVEEPTIIEDYRVVRIELSVEDARTLLQNRRTEVPSAASAVAEVEKRMAAASGPIIDSSALYPDLDSVSKEEIREAILTAHEVRVLFLRSLLKGVARASVAGQPIHSATARYYEARDAIGKVNGVMVVAADQKLFDYCATDPSK